MRYFIHVQNGDGLVPDEQGQEFPNVDLARKHALRAAADIIADEIKGGCQVVQLTLHIHDEEDRQLVSLPVTAAVEEPGR